MSVLRGDAVTDPILLSRDVEISGDLELTGALDVTGTFDVTGNVAINGSLDIKESVDITAATTQTAAIEIGKGRSGNGHSYIDLIGDATYTDYGARFIRYNSGANAITRLAHKGTGDFEIHANEAAKIKFYANALNWVTFESDGLTRLGANRTGEAVYVTNDGNNLDRRGISIVCGADSPSSAGDCLWLYLYDGDGGALSKVHYVTTTPYAAFAAASDERIKKNIAPTQINGLDIINNLPLEEFDYKDGKHPHQKISWVAQHVKDVYPPMVAYDKKEDLYSVSDSCLIPVLVKAVQELSGEFSLYKATAEEQIDILQAAQAASQAAQVALRQEIADLRKVVQGLKTAGDVNA